jgi:hypothetical protein
VKIRSVQVEATTAARSGPRVSSVERGGCVAIPIQSYTRLLGASLRIGGSPQALMHNFAEKSPPSSPPQERNHGIALSVIFAASSGAHNYSFFKFGARTVTLELEVRLSRNCLV